MHPALPRQLAVPPWPRRAGRDAVALLAASLLVTACQGQPSTVHLDISGLRASGLAAGYTLDTVQVIVTDTAAPQVTLATVDVDRSTDTFDLTVSEGDRTFTLNAFRLAGQEDIPVFIGETRATLVGGTEVDLEIPAYPVGVVNPTLVVANASLPTGATLTLTAARQTPGIVPPLTVGDGGLKLVGAGTLALSGTIVGGSTTYTLVAPKTITVAAGDLLTPKVWFAEGGLKCAAGNPAELLALAPACRKLNVRVAGLEGSGLVVSGAGSQLSPTTNGTFLFANGIADGDAYTVKVEAMPAHQICTADAVTATGVASGLDVTVNVTCVAMRQVSAVVTGLAASGLSLTLASTSPTETLPVATNGTHPFATRLAEGVAYVVAVGAQPTGQLCTVDPATDAGTVAKTDVSVSVTCATLYNVAATVTGLVGSGLTLQFTSGTATPEVVSVTQNGTSQFATPVVDGGAYSVFVATQPANPTQTCTPSIGFGTVTGANVTVTVTCVTALRPAAAVVAGLLAGTKITVSLVAGLTSEALVVSANGTTMFTKQFTEGQSYTASITSQPTNSDNTPTGARCDLASAGGNVPAGTLNLAVYCVGPVEPAFVNGPQWTDHVVAATAPAPTLPDLLDVTPAAACTQSTPGYYSACVHSGEVRAIQVTDVTSCTGVTASDDLNLFTWSCGVVPAGGGILLTSALAAGKGLSDVVDTTALVFRPNAVTIFDGTRNRRTAVGTWWTNSVGTLAAFRAATLPPYWVVVLAAPTDNAQTISTAPDHTSIVVRSGDTIESFTTMLNFGWLEGQFASTVTLGSTAVTLYSATRGVVRNLTVTSSLGDGISLNGGTAGLLEDVTVQNTTYNGINVMNASSLTYSNVKISKPQMAGITVMSATGGFLTNVDVQDSVGPGITMSGSGAAVTMDTVSVSGAGNDGIRVNTAPISSLSNIRTSRNSGIGFTFGFGCDGSTLSNISSWQNAGTGIALESNRFTLTTAVSADNGADGIIDFDGSTVGGRLNDITTFNNAAHGVALFRAQSWTLTGVTSFANAGAGINAPNLRGSVLTDVTVAMNGTAGVALGDGNLLQNAVAYGEVTGITAGSSLTARNLALLWNDTGLSFPSTPGTNSIAGTTIVHDNHVVCSLMGGPDCTGTDVTLANGASTPSPFVGALSTNDLVNASDTLGASPFDAPLTDWIRFESLRRGWGLDAVSVAYPRAAAVRCVAGTTCRIYDWRLRPSTDLLAVVPRAGTPTGTGASTGTHTWYSAQPPADQAACTTLAPGSTFTGLPASCRTTFYLDAVELPFRSGSNNNGLCEPGETCANARNVGADQGTSAVVSSPTLITGVVLYDFVNPGVTP